MNSLKQKWLDMLGTPPKSENYGKSELIRKLSHKEFDAEIYRQENGEGKAQRVMMLFPKELDAPAPAAAVPFYFPEAMLGFNPETDEMLDKYKDIEMMLHLVRRGYIVASADSYHLTYIESEKDIEDFSRWQDAADALLKDYPDFTGMGKLFYDTELLVDLIYKDARVDKSRIGIAGHSLGGKMAFYTGCLDDRISAILASDFGIGWKQTNWHNDWYWSKRVDNFIKEGFDHSELLSIAAPKPFCLLAGKFDDDNSYTIMLKAQGYEEHKDRLKIVNHKLGHRPPLWALDEGYDFFDKYVKNK